MDIRSHINQEVTSLCACWKINRKDGVSLYLTDLDKDITVDGKLYKASDGYNRDVLRGNNGTSTDELEINGVLSSEFISEDDLNTGKYDHAEITLFMVNWADPAMGIIPLKRGWIGEVTWQENYFTAELRGISDVLKREQSSLYTAECTADFCDDECGLNNLDFQWDDEVAEVTEDGAIRLKSFSDGSAQLSGGLVTFLSGENRLRSMEISSWDFPSKTLQLFLDLPEPIGVGDEVKLTAGCDKSFATCKGSFSNQINFRGFPDIPGTDRLLGGASSG